MTQPTTQPITLAELAGRERTACRLGDSALIMIDCQNTYTTGVMTLHGVGAALDEAQKLLERARRAGTPVIHIAHDSGPGTPYDVSAEIGQIVSQVAPLEGEPTVVKNFPNAFAKTDLNDRLRALGKTNLIVAGFMTHMCVNSTVRAGFDLGYRTTVVANATATRDLPRVGNGVIDAQSLHEASLSELSDLFAVVVESADDLLA